MTADATSAVAAFTAYPTAVWRTRKLLTGVLGSGWLWLLLIPCVLGGLIGALLLSHTGNRNFVEFVPWLVLLATIIIALRPILCDEEKAEACNQISRRCSGPWLWRAFSWWRLYCGHFGAGIGILMIGALTDFHFAGRNSPCRCAEEFFEWLDEESRCLCSYWKVTWTGSTARQWPSAVWLAATSGE
jgi:hypothetical protein